jgi:hypothetical protein
MKQTLAALAKHPLTYVLAFALSGAACVVAGVALLAGMGWSLMAAGAFLIASAAFITKGLTPNG